MALQSLRSTYNCLLKRSIMINYLYYVTISRAQRYLNIINTTPGRTKNGSIVPIDTMQAPFVFFSSLDHMVGRDFCSHISHSFPFIDAWLITQLNSLSDWTDSKGVFRRPPSHRNVDPYCWSVIAVVNDPFDVGAAFASGFLSLHKNLYANHSCWVLIARGWMERRIESGRHWNLL